MVHKTTPTTGTTTVDIAITAIHFFFTYPLSSTNICSHPTQGIKGLKCCFCSHDSLQFTLHVVHLPIYPSYLLQNFTIVPSPQLSHDPRDSSGISMNPFLYGMPSLFFSILHRLRISTVITRYNQFPNIHSPLPVHAGLTFSTSLVFCHQFFIHIFPFFFLFLLQTS